MKYEYSEFVDWFEELEGFSLRCERFYDQFGNNSDSVIAWLQAAFDAGRTTKETK